MTIASGLGILLILPILGWGLRSYEPKWDYVSWLIFLAIIIGPAVIWIGLHMFDDLVKNWDTLLKQANSNLKTGSTLLIAPRADLTLPKVIGFWRRIRELIPRGNEFPSQHIAWEIISDRRKFFVAVRVPSNLVRNIAGELTRDFPNTTITFIPDRDQDRKPNSPFIDPLQDILQQGLGANYVDFRLNKPELYPVYSGENPDSHIKALLNAINFGHAKATVGYQFLIREAHPGINNRWQGEVLALEPKPDKNGRIPKVPPEQAQLIKILKERVTQSAYELTIRCWVASDDGQVIQDEIKRLTDALVGETRSMGPYNALSASGKPQTDIAIVAQRQFSDSSAVVLTDADLGGFLFLPDKKIIADLPRLAIAKAKRLPPPVSLVIPPDQRHLYRQYGVHEHPTGDIDEVGVLLNELRKHSTTTGPTGSGKSVGMIHSIINDLENNASTVVLEPSGTIPQELARSLPPRLISKAILFDPSSDQPFSMNMCGIGLDLGLDTAVDNATASIRQALKSNWDSAVRMRQLITNGLAVTMDVLWDFSKSPKEQEGASILALARFLTDPEYQEKIVRKASVNSLAAADFWQKDFWSWTEAKQTESVATVMNRIGKWLEKAYVRRTMAMPYLTIDWDELMGGRLDDPNGADPKLIMVPLHKRLGEEPRALIGAVIVRCYASSLLMRDSYPEEFRRTAAIHIDEFPDFVGSSGPEEIELILAQLRKYGASANLYLQTLSQIGGRIAVEVDTNTLTKIFYKMPQPKDAKMAAAQMAGKLDAFDFQNMEDYHAYVRKGNESPAYVRMSPPSPYTGKQPSPQKGFYKKPEDPRWHDLVVENLPFSPYVNTKPEKIDKGSPSGLEGIELLRWVITASARKTSNTELVSQIASMPTDEFNQLCRVRERFDHWRARELKNNPGLVQDPFARIQNYSKWRYGIPWWETDAKYIRYMRPEMAGGQPNRTVGGIEVPPPVGGTKDIRPDENEDMLAFF